MLKVCVTPLGYIEFIAKEEYVKGMRYSSRVHRVHLIKRLDAIKQKSCSCRSVSISNCFSVLELLVRSFKSLSHVTLIRLK